jgi:hypothetical protein
VAAEHQGSVVLDVNVADPSNLIGHLSQLKSKLGVTIGLARDLFTARPAIKSYYRHPHTLANVTRSGWP